TISRMCAVFDYIGFHRRPVTPRVDRPGGRFHLSCKSPAARSAHTAHPSTPPPPRPGTAPTHGNTPPGPETVPPALAARIHRAATPRAPRSPLPPDPPCSAAALPDADAPTANYTWPAQTAPRRAPPNSA